MREAEVWALLRREVAAHAHQVRRCGRSKAHFGNRDIILR